MNTKVPVSVKVLSIVSMSIGIMSLVFSWIYGTYILFAIGAVVTSKIAGNKAAGMDTGKYATFAKTGFITGVIGIICNAIAMIIWIALFVLGTAASIMQSIYYW